VLVLRVIKDCWGTDGWWFLLLGSVLHCCAQLDDVQFRSVHPDTDRMLLFRKPCHLQKPFVVHSSSMPQQPDCPSLVEASHTTAPWYGEPSAKKHCAFTAAWNSDAASSRYVDDMASIATRALQCT
jgi:hypothetical protein